MNELVSSETEKQLHSHLLEVLNGHSQFNVSSINGNLESYFELPLLVQIAEKYPATREEMAGGLSDKANLVYRCWSTIVSIENNKRSNWWITYTELCQWLGFNDDPKSTQQTAPKIQAKLENMAGDLLVLAEPFWGRSKSIIVYGDLNELAKPATTKFLHAIEFTSGDWGQSGWLALERSQPDVDQVRPFFDNTNVYIAASAINAVRKKLSPTDATVALDILCFYSSHPGGNIWLQNQINDLIPLVFEQLHELARPAVPKLLRAMEFSKLPTLDYWYALDASQPEVDQVRTFFNSTNLNVAVAAIQSVQTKLSLADASIALEKSQSSSHPGERSWIQWQIEKVIPILATRINDVHSDQSN